MKATPAAATLQQQLSLTWFMTLQNCFTLKQATRRVTFSLPSCGVSFTTDWKFPVKNSLAVNWCTNIGS